jgi:hypothetical protein
MWLRHHRRLLFLFVDRGAPLLVFPSACGIANSPIAGVLSILPGLLGDEQLSALSYLFEVVTTKQQL